MDMRTKKAFLRTTAEVGKKIFNIGLIVSVTAIWIGKPEFTDVWKVMMPFGFFCWVVGFVAESKLDKLMEP